MKREGVEVENRELLERGNDRGIPFQEPWKKCHLQECRKVSGKKGDGTLVIKCVPTDVGCEDLGDVWCCCDLFRFRIQTPPEDRRWEHVPIPEEDKDKWHEQEEGYFYECFCVRISPWEPGQMPCESKKP